MTNDGPLESQQPAFEPDPRKFAAAQFQRANLTLPELWTYYYGIGGSADELVLDAYLNEILAENASPAGGSPPYRHQGDYGGDGNMKGSSNVRGH